MSAGRSNVLTREELLRFSEQERELEAKTQELKECQLKLQQYEQDWQYLGEHLTNELKKRLPREDVNKFLRELSEATERSTKGETLDWIIASTFEVISRTEEETDQALEEGKQENKALKENIKSLKRQLEEAEETTAELEKELGVAPLQQEEVRARGIFKKWSPRKLIFHERQREREPNSTGQGEPVEVKKQTLAKTSGGQVPKDNTLDITINSEKLPKKTMADVYDKIMDLVTRYIPTFSGERSPKLAKEVHRFLSCCKDLYDRLKAEEQPIFMKCVRYRLLDDAYYLVSSEEPEDFEALQQTIQTAYMPRKSYCELRAEMIACVQRPGDDIKDYADRLKELLSQIKAAVSAKYPGKDGGLIAEIEADAVATFKAGVMQQNTQLYLTGRKFQSLDEARDEADYFEMDARRLKIKEPGLRNYDREVNRGIATSSWGTGRFNKDGPKGIGTPIRPATSGMHRSPPTQAKQPRPIQCFQCGEWGHYAKECRERKQPPYCTKCRIYGHEATGCKKQHVRFADVLTSSPVEDQSDTKVLYCQFCKTSDHYTAICLKKFLAENNNQQEGNGRWQLGNNPAAAFN